MACLEKKSILDMPDLVIEMILSFLSFCDLFNISKGGKRLEDCAKRVMKKKPFSKYNQMIIRPHGMFENILL